MEFAVRICALAVYVLYLLESIEAQKPCKVPNGGGGTCIHISKCQPLTDLYKKKFKTPRDNMYIQQSYCGSPGAAKLKVCCPSQTLWNIFEAKPVTYPTRASQVFSPAAAAAVTHLTNSPIFTTTTETPIVTIPPLDDLQSRIYEGNQAKEQEEIDRLCGPESPSSNKIFGGDSVAIDEYGWLALLEYSGGNLACGGSLISHKFVLTAAHCLAGRYGAPVFVRLAEYNTTSFPTDSVEVDGGGFDNITVDIVPVKSIHVHEQSPSEGQFPTERYHDIGLIKLMRSVQINGDFIKTICLPPRDFRSEFGSSTNFTIAGWGRTESDEGGSPVKLQVSVPYVPPEQYEVQNPNVKDRIIRAGGVEGKDSCDGDSGGPLMYFHEDRYYAVGVLSSGPKACGTEGRPATHTDVYTYLPWIKKTMRENYN